MIGSVTLIDYLIVIQVKLQFLPDNCPGYLLVSVPADRSL